MRLPESRLVNRVVVSDGFDAADDWIVDHITIGDIAVTTDIPLAARCLAKQAQVIGPTGRPFTEDSIGVALAMRELKGHLRDTGEIRDHGPSFTKNHRSSFLQALEQAVQAAGKLS